MLLKELNDFKAEPIAFNPLSVILLLQTSSDSYPLQIFVIYAEKVSLRLCKEPNVFKAKLRFRTPSSWTRSQLSINFFSIQIFPYA